MLQERVLRWLLRICPARGQNTNGEAPVAIATDVGIGRDENQDRVAAMCVTPGGTSQSFLAIALADGMGGMREGRQCAALTISAFFLDLVKHRNVPVEQRLESAVHFANSTVNAYSGGRGGATLSSVLVPKHGQAFLANVGDSRIYSINVRSKEPELIRLTRDDSLEEIVGGHGRDLLQFVGMGASLKPHIDKLPSDVDPFFLTSDGIHFVNQEVLALAAFYSGSSHNLAERLTTLSQWCGGHDNASIAVTSISEITGFLQGDLDSGVEIWDPFGSLQILWARDSVAEIDERTRVGPPKSIEPDFKGKEDRPKAQTEDGQRLNPRTRTKQKKPSVGRRAKSGQKEKPMQLEIEVSSAPAQKAKDK